MKNIVMLADYCDYLKSQIKYMQKLTIDLPDNPDTFAGYELIAKYNQFLAKVREKCMYPLRQELTRCKYESLQCNNTIEINKDVVDPCEFYNWCVESKKQ